MNHRRNQKWLGTKLSLSTRFAVCQPSAVHRTALHGFLHVIVLSVFVLSVSFVFLLVCSPCPFLVQSLPEAFPFTVFISLSDSSPISVRVSLNRSDPAQATHNGTFVLLSKNDCPRNMLPKIPASILMFILVRGSPFNSKHKLRN